MLSALETLKTIIETPGPVEAVEDIYHKRHIAAGIPSMYGSYREPRFEAMGLTFRLEALAAALCDRAIDDLDLTPLDYPKLVRIGDWFRLLLRAVRLGRLPGAGPDALRGDARRGPRDAGDDARPVPEPVLAGLAQPRDARRRTDPVGLRRGRQRRDHPHARGGAHRRAGGGVDRPGHPGDLGRARARPDRRELRPAAPGPADRAGGAGDRGPAHARQRDRGVAASHPRLHAGDRRDRRPVGDRRRRGAGQQGRHAAADALARIPDPGRVRADDRVRPAPLRGGLGGHRRRTVGAHRGRGRHPRTAHGRALRRSGQAVAAVGARRGADQHARHARDVSERRPQRRGRRRARAAARPRLGRLGRLPAPDAVLGHELRAASRAVRRPARRGQVALRGRQEGAAVRATACARSRSPTGSC